MRQSSCLWRVVQGTLCWPQSVNAFGRSPQPRHTLRRSLSANTRLAHHQRKAQSGITKSAAASGSASDPSKPVGLKDCVRLGMHDSVINRQKYIYQRYQPQSQDLQLDCRPSVFVQQTWTDLKPRPSPLLVVMNIATTHRPTQAHPKQSSCSMASGTQLFVGSTCFLTSPTCPTDSSCLISLDTQEAPNQRK